MKSCRAKLSTTTPSGEAFTGYSTFTLPLPLPLPPSCLCHVPQRLTCLGVRVSFVTIGWAAFGSSTTSPTAAAPFTLLSYPNAQQPVTGRTHGATPGGPPLPPAPPHPTTPRAQTTPPLSHTYLLGGQGELCEHWLGSLRLFNHITHCCCSLCLTG